MKRLLKLLIFLYPARWRRRYGQELEALLEDSPSRWHDLGDLFLGAIQMQISKWSFGIIVAACGIAGLALTSIIAFSMPYRYRSTAIIKLETPGGSPAGPALERVAAAGLSPEALAGIIRAEHLYTRQLTATPIEDVIDVMRRAIRVEPSGSNQARISFAYEDPGLAQRTSQDLVTRIISANVNQDVNQGGLRLELVTPADPGRQLIERKRYALAHLGLPVGVIAGVVLAVFLRRRTRTVS